MHQKTNSRLRRARRSRMHIRNLEANRLSVHRTPQHIYAQVLAADGSRTLVSASTVEKQLRDECEATGNQDAARRVGKMIAERAREAGVVKVAFDRSGFAYHGRVKALADAARESGLQF